MASGEDMNRGTIVAQGSSQRIGSSQRGRRQRARWTGALFASTIAALAGMAPHAVGQGGDSEAFVERGLPRLVLAEGDAPPGSVFRASELVDLQALPNLYDPVVEAGLQALFRTSFDVGEGEVVSPGYLYSQAFLFPDTGRASQALPLLCSGCQGEPLDLGEQGTYWTVGGQPAQLAWRRSNVILEIRNLAVDPEGALPGTVLRSLAEKMDADALALKPGLGAGQAPGDTVTHRFTEDDLPGIVLTSDDAPQGAVQSEDEYEELTEDAREGGLVAGYLSCFDPWVPDVHTLCSEALMYRDAEAAMGAMVAIEELIAEAGTVRLGEGGVTNTTTVTCEQGDLRGTFDRTNLIAWRRNNLVMTLHLADMQLEESAGGLSGLLGEAPPCPEQEALPLAEEMDARAVALATAGSTGDGGGGALPWIAAALAALVAAALAGTWLRSRTAPAAAAAARPRGSTTEPGPAIAPQEAPPKAPEPRSSSPARPEESPPSQAEPRPRTKYCRNCGAPHPAEARFCGTCGHPFG